MEKNETSQKDRSKLPYALALRIAADFGAGIGAPAVLGAIIGKRLDERFGTDPWILALCLLLAFALTVVYLRRKTDYYAKEYEKIG